LSLLNVCIGQGASDPFLRSHPCVFLDRHPMCALGWGLEFRHNLPFGNGEQSRGGTKCLLAVTGVVARPLFEGRVEKLPLEPSQVESPDDILGPNILGTVYDCSPPSESG
jgi:hypothetical protein